MIMISAFLMAMIDGLVISDAGLRLRGNPLTANANFYLSSSRREFLEKVSATFSKHGITGKIREVSPGRKMLDLGYGNNWRYETQCLPFFTSLYKKWYKNNVKIVPEFKTLEPVMLAYWLAGDGSNQLDSHHKRSRRIIFCTECFTEKEQNYLVQKFEDIGIYAHTQPIRCNKNGDDQFRIIISRAVDVNIFIDKVEPFVPLEFRYKIARPTVLRINEQHFTKKRTPEEKKARKAEYERERYKRNRESILAQQKEYYGDNREEIRERREPYVEEYNNRPEVKERSAKWKAQDYQRKKHGEQEK